MFALILRTCALSRNDASVRWRCCATDVRNMCYEGYVHTTCMSDRESGVRGLPLATRAVRVSGLSFSGVGGTCDGQTRRRGRANAKVSPDDNYTCHKASLGAVVTRETIAERRRFGLPFLECSSELSVMAVSVQRHYFYFRPSSPTSVRVWQTCWLAPVPRQSDGRGTRDRTPNSNYREENRQSPATTPPHPPTGSAQTP